MSILTLTTDFGTVDWFVGTMKGVILNIQPRAQVVDITHDVPAGDIRAGAFALAASYKFFPKRTVHVAVVDPGVGSRRRSIAVRTADYFFVGPDNGVLSLALAREKIKAVHLLTNERLFLHPTSNTFHGRDVFAPVAANLSKGLSLGRVGPAIKQFVKPSWPDPQHAANSIKGEIVYIDRFGNAITNIANAALAQGEFKNSRKRRSRRGNEAEVFFARKSASSRRRLPFLNPPCVLTALAEGSCEIFVRGKRLCALHPFYQAVPHGSAVAVPGSSGFLELAVNGGSAAKKHSLNVADAVIVRLFRSS